jgi:hypothetical protein
MNTNKKKPFSRVSSRYMNRNENFVLVCLGSSGDLELAALLFDQDAVTAKWCQ